MTFNRYYHDKIISIFKNGITFWHFRSGMAYNTFKPFNYNYENIEVDLLLQEVYMNLIENIEQLPDFKKGKIICKVPEDQWVKKIVQLYKKSI